jgi:hydroxyethylthiazole kinase-like uncharacterized protein yjeF
MAGQKNSNDEVPDTSVAALALVEWTVLEAAQCIRVPASTDDKYRHGVLGVITGSSAYPGAAVLGVDAAHATGVGMVRFLGDPVVAERVMQRRPETVLVDGRVQAWLLGSGTEWTLADTAPTAVTRALTSGEPTVCDAGALPLAEHATGITVVTPHHAECARLLNITREQVDAEPLASASAVADRFHATVVLKGHVTLIVSPAHAGERFARCVTAGTTWLATAGTGDVLAGIMGALLATNADELDSGDEGSVGESSPSFRAAELAATAVLIHGRAALRAGSGGPFGASDIAPHLGAVIAGIVENHGDA